MVGTRKSYSLYILLLVPILLFFIIVHVFQYSPWKQPHNVTQLPQNVLHNTTIEKALVVVTETLKDCLWMDNVDPTWTKYIYLVTEDSLNPPSSDITLSVPVNKGNEAMRYLSFIIDHYRNLPSIIAFRHGHDKSWHQQLHSAAEVNHLNLTTMRERGYQNFRCTLNDGVYTHDCPDDQKDHLLHNGKPYWEGVDSETKDTYADIWDAWFGGPRPEYLMSACCAQFVVTRESVLKRSREKYMEYRQFLIDTDLHDYHAGRIFEKTWHVVFGMPPVSCETEEECMCEVYTAPLGCGQGSV